MWSPDGTRALITTNDFSPATGTAEGVTTVNTTTDTQIGATVTLTGILSGGGNPLGLALSPKARALIATTPATGDARTSQVTVIDAATGSQIGNTVIIDGALSGLRWSADGTRDSSRPTSPATGADLSIRETILKTL